MIAIARSGNNNLCHPLSYIVTLDRGERPVLGRRFFAKFTPIHEPYPRKLAGRRPLPSGRINARPVPVPTLGGSTDLAGPQIWRANKFLRATSFPLRIATGAGAYAQSPSPA